MACRPPALPDRHFALAMLVVFLGLAGCGRTELFSGRKHCAPTDTVCQAQVDGGGAGLGGNPGTAGHPGAGSGGADATAARARAASRDATAARARADSPAVTAARARADS